MDSPEGFFVSKKPLIPAQDTPGTELVKPLPGKLGQMLEETLDAGEEVEVSLHTSIGQAFAVTDKRVITMNAFLWDQSIASFVFDTLSGVELKIGLLNHLELMGPGIDDGSLTIVGVGGTSGAIGGGVGLVTRNPVGRNVVNYRPELAPAMKKAKAIISRRIAAARGAGKNVAHGTGTDLPASLRELASLREQGVIDDAEFEKAKAKLLGA